MTDVELARAVERGEVPNEGFHHVDHLRVALVYLNESSTVEDAIHRMASSLRRFAAAAGKPEKYSQATTEFWIYQMAAARAAKEIYPDLNVQAFNGNIVYDLGLGVFRWADIVLGGLDNREARLAINRACWRLNKPWID